MNDGMSWYSHWAREYENPPEDEEYEDDRFDDWRKEADCWRRNDE